MKAERILFTLPALPCYAIAHKEGRKTLEIEAFDGLLNVAVEYDYNRAPLCLTASADEGDSFTVHLMPYRIELYKNGVLVDEEWPAGERLYAIGDTIEGTILVSSDTYMLPAEETKNVLGEFFGAEGWRPEENVFVGDCMPYVRDNIFHLLYLKDRHHHRSKWGLGAHQWAHISSSDLKHWQNHPMAVEITDPEEGSICTGSWIRRGEKDYLFYTVRRGKGLSAPIRRSVSSDGYHFEKDTAFEFVLPERYNIRAARDPKVILGEDGRFHMFLTTQLVAENRGCLAHLVSDDLDNWEDAGTPIYVAEDATHPECPDYIVYGDRYYLIFSLHGKAHYLVSDRPFDGWKQFADPVIPCATVPKGAVWNGKIVFAGFVKAGGYGGNLTFCTATAAESGELIFETGKGE